jgi:hypothetical protein
MFCIFFAGFGLCGYETTVYVYITEISGNGESLIFKNIHLGERFRNTSGNVLFTVWAVA